MLSNTYSEAYLCLIDSIIYPSGDPISPRMECFFIPEAREFFPKSKGVI
jgi:hypothetical protein